MFAWLKTVNRTVLLGVTAMATTLLASPLTPVSSKTEPDARSRFDQIFSGSFTSGAAECCTDSELVLVSWNIRRGVRQTEILQALRGPLAADLYLLQEVDLHARRTGYRKVAEEIARELGMNYVFGIEFEELAQGGSGVPAFHGQAVLSRFPISRARTLRFRHQLHDWGSLWVFPLPHWSWLQPRRGGRMALVVEIQVGGRTYVVYNVHLESRANDAGRARQAQEILEDIEAHYTSDTPVIVAGDLNTDKGADSQVVQVLKQGGFHDVLQDHTGPLRTMVHADRRADWILLRPLHSWDARVLKLNISDHYPLMVRIALPVAIASCSLRHQQRPSAEKPG